MLGLPWQLVSCATGDIQTPLPDLAAPAAWYGYPPALLPIWSGGSGPRYIGYWKHWFSKRRPSYVEMFVGSGRMTLEIARTPQQLYSVIAIDAIGLEEGVGATVGTFAEQVGLENLDEIDRVSMATGDDPLGLAAIGEFQSQTPLESVQDKARYDGDFPHEVGGRPVGLDDACSFELVDQKIDWQTWPSRPAWLSEEAKPPLFDQFLDAGNLHGAWLTLNSTGWTIREARAAIVRLAERARDAEFDALTAAYLAAADARAGAY